MPRFPNDFYCIVRNMLGDDSSALWPAYIPFLEYMQRQGGAHHFWVKVFESVEKQ